jgi:hypothetical protein
MSKNLFFVGILKATNEKRAGSGSGSGSASQRHGCTTLLPGVAEDGVYGAVAPQHEHGPDGVAPLRPLQGRPEAEVYRHLAQGGRGGSPLTCNATHRLISEVRKAVLRIRAPVPF